ncbi:hypothetical protein [Candidatus Chlorohelix sp.]|uniref:hypothetical protein n=1 Tax=Candidatus Chlorohelix sp. TaxID=3139201 RepID=UPI00302A76AA
MKPKHKTLRDTQSLPTFSAIPRTSGSMFLMMNRLATERDRLCVDEADLLSRLEQKRRRIAKIDSEIDYYRSQIDLLNKPPVPRQSPVRKPSTLEAIMHNDDRDEPESSEPVIIEY